MPTIPTIPELPSTKSAPPKSQRYDLGIFQVRGLPIVDGDYPLYADWAPPSLEMIADGKMGPSPAVTMRPPTNRGVLEDIVANFGSGVSRVVITRAWTTAQDFVTRTREEVRAQANRTTYMVIGVAIILIAVIGGLAWWKASSR
jgi:hypothetical protein